MYLHHRVTDLGVDSARQHNEYSMAVVLNTLRLMVGSQWTPQEIQFAHQTPAQTTEHNRIFGVPVLFGRATNALVVEREFIERQVPAADPRLYRILQRYLEHVLADMPPEDKVLASVRKGIAETMREALGREPQRPAGFENLEKLPQRFEIMDADVGQVRHYISAATSHSV